MSTDLPMPLVVGAGPVGLTMVCELARHGVRCRIVDQAHERSQTSRALGIFPRTLEVFETMGVAEKFVAAGHRVRGMAMHHGAEVIGSLDLTSVTSPFPFALVLPQSETERLLGAHLAGFGIAVERDVCLTNITQNDDLVQATLRRVDGQMETFDTPWLIGCDGAHSATRNALNLSFDGAQYDESFILADARIEGAPSRDQIHLFFGNDGLLGVIPFGENYWRVIANIPPKTRTQELPEVTLEEVQSLTNRRALATMLLSEPIWMARFHISHRKVQHFRKLRAFVAGDAAHIHSPAGGQGMNTGIQDAFNLAWKMALVVQGLAPAPLLASYEAEREPVARGVLALTDRVTRMATMRNSFAQGIRDLLLPAVSGIHLVGEKLAERLSELDLHYRESSLSQNDGQHGRVRAGDRAPDGELRDANGKARRLFELFSRPQAVLLIFLGSAVDAETNANETGAWLSGISSDTISAFRITRGHSPAAADLQDLTGQVHQSYGLTKGGIVFVRPDGYIGYRGDEFDPSKLRAYLARIYSPNTGGV